jgi:hypothetical protein
VTWLDLLKDVRRGNNSPSRQEIANWSGLAVTRVGDILTGRAVPTRPELIQLVSGIDPEKEMLEEILAAFQDETGAG